MGRLLPEVYTEYHTPNWFSKRRLIARLGDAGSIAGRGTLSRLVEEAKLSQAMTHCADEFPFRNTATPRGNGVIPGEPTDLAPRYPGLQGGYL